MFKKEFMTSVTLTERVYMHGENQRIDRTLTDNEGHVICHEDYPVLSRGGGKLHELACQISELSHAFFNDGISFHKISQNVHNPLNPTEISLKPRFRLQFLKFKNHLVKLLKKYGFFKHKTSFS